MNLKMLFKNVLQINSNYSTHWVGEVMEADFYTSEAGSHVLKSAVWPQLHSHLALKLEQHGTPATSA